MTADIPEATTVDVDTDTLRYDPGTRPVWGIDCPRCGDFVGLAAIIDPDVSACDCGVTLTVSVTARPPSYAPGTNSERDDCDTRHTPRDDDDPTR